MKYVLQLVCLVFLCSTAHAEPIPTPGKVTLLDLGSDCIPCDIQDRIIRRLEKEFTASVSVLYLDVEKQPHYKQTYGIDIIPTLIFFDKNGQEAARQSGYMKEGAIRTLLKKLTEG